MRRHSPAENRCSGIASRLAGINGADLGPPLAIVHGQDVILFGIETIERVRAVRRHRDLRVTRRVTEGIHRGSDRGV